MRVILFGDPAAGKSTFLRSVRDDLYHVHFEQLTQKLHRGIYHDPILKYLWYTFYNFERDHEDWFSEKPLFVEYCTHTRYAYVEAYRRVGRFTDQEAQLVNHVLDRVNTVLPLHQDDIALHFVCSMDAMAQRYHDRPPHMDKNSPEYFAALREALEAYFHPRCHYFRIDTTRLSSTEVRETIKREALPWVEYKVE